ncbi:MAG: DUF3526 domain-containing protein [Candidatus Eremiobacteraeota bacterium]|nr:DUF3526 domain-containing protein [Candidatus Eremiobacteraeota bacterium]MCW5869383.1 DUF3526 domain-containing protein [Candidatus Eremiobacteraeota bacterium]
MSLAVLTTILRYEFLLLLRSRGSLAALVLLLLSGGYALFYGRQELAHQQAVMAAFPARQKAMDSSYLNARFGKQEAAGRVGFYLNLPAVHEPLPQAALALGVRDLHPYCLGLRLLSLQSQKYDSNLENPIKLMAGNFDLSVVVVQLLPLAIIALTYNLRSGEEEKGTLRLLQTASLPLAQVLGLKLLLRVGLLTLAMNALLGLGWLASGASGAIWPWLALLNGYLLFWIALVLWIVSFGRNSSWNAIVLLGCWLVFTTLLPSLTNLAIQRALPLDRGYRLTLQARQSTHEGWDQDKKAMAEEFLKLHPRWATLCRPDPEKFTWSWYFANQLVADDRVAADASAYLDGLKERELWTYRAGLLCPPLNLQQNFDSLAGTDLTAEILFLEGLDQAHRQLQDLLLPEIFAERKLNPQEYSKLLERLQTWRFQPRPNSGRVGESLLALCLTSSLFLVLARTNARRNLG